MKEAALLLVLGEAVAEETGARRPARLTRATHARDVPGWDSLSHARILLALEARLGIRIDIARTYEMGDVGALIDYVGELAHG